MQTSELVNLKLLKLKQLEEEIELKEGLPHLYAFKDYNWSKEFIDTKNKTPVLVCANQVGKSTSQIRRLIKLATDPSLWPEYWPELIASGQKPTQFWYLYPTRDVATAEFLDKWTPMLPQGKYKDHPQYGWKTDKLNKQINSLTFNSGITVYFKTYSQDVMSLQSGTVAHIFTDEEIDVELIDELLLRISAQNGYMSFVFTATKGQEFWREVVEERSRWPDAQIWQVSMYECQVFSDGTPSRWTDERIDMVKARCKSEAEILRRVFGRFIVDSGKKYGTYVPSKHYINPVDIPKEWQRYAGLDWGGGGDSHPSAISFIAVNPDYTKGYVYKFWRGGEKDLTTAEDVLTKFIQMKGDDEIAAISYDYSAKDMGTIAERSGIPVVKANKSHVVGEGSLNTLFKNNMLFIFAGEEAAKLSREFQTVLIATAKRSAKDDGIDATRYAAVEIPWAFDKIVPEFYKSKPKAKEELTFKEKMRPGEELIAKQELTGLYQAEIEFWNNLGEI